MLRLFLSGFVIIIVLVVTIVSLLLAFAIVRGVKRLFSASGEFVEKQYQDWQKDRAEKQTEKDMPDFLRQAKQRMQHIEQQVARLNSKWRALLHPLMTEAKALYQRGQLNPQQAAIVRPFFTVTLKTLESFVQALLDMQGQMQADEEEKARQNIDVLLNDVYKYRARLESKKRFDFHVIMDVVRQRLGR